MQRLVKVYLSIKFQEEKLETFSVRTKAYLSKSWVENN